VNFNVGASAARYFWEAKVGGAKDVPFRKFALLKTER
jgi:hypothetical protein